MRSDKRDGRAFNNRILIVAVRVRRIGCLALAPVGLYRTRLVEPEQVREERGRVAPPCEEEQKAAADVDVRRRSGPRRYEDGRVHEIWELTAHC